MDEELMLDVDFKNETLQFPIQLHSYSYSYKLEVNINGTKLLFEPDEYRNWRAVLSEEDIISNKVISKELLIAIIETIEKLFSHSA